MQDENSKLLKQYQKIFKMFVDHMNICHALEKQVINDFDFEENACADQGAHNVNVRTLDPPQERSRRYND